MRPFKIFNRTRLSYVFVAMKHYQFQVNMSQDNEFYGVAQDNPQLITYIREVHLTPAIEPHHKMLESEDTISNDTIYVLKLLNNKVSEYCWFYVNHKVY